MKEIGAVTIGKLIEAYYEKDECKFKSYAEFIAEAYKERGEERAERIIRSKIDGSYKNKPVVVTLDKERKEELKDEMKNRISLALKVPILQQGFEIICKEIVELKADNDARKFAMAMSEKVEKQLREENEELKAQLWGAKSTCNNCGNADCENFQMQRRSVPCELWISHRDKIIMSKEIIRNLLCLLEEYKEQIVFNEDLQKIKKAADFLNN